MSPRLRTWDIAINERPAANSLCPRSIIAFDNVRPWLLCTVIAHTKQTGTCKREHDVSFLLSHVYQISIIKTTFVLSRAMIVGPW